MILEDILEWLEHVEETAVVRSMEDIFSFSTDTGLHRSDNQDRVAALKVTSSSSGSGFLCTALCDGMGGLSDGSKAASVGLANFFFRLVQDRKFPPEERLRSAANDASAAIRAETSSGGATLSACLIEEGGVYTINVGDSRIYQLDTDDKATRLTRLSIDDTMEEAYGATGKGLLQYLGMQGQLVPHVKSIDSQNSNSILITSDGAHIIGDPMLERLYDRGIRSEDYVARIVKLASWIGGIDNSTAIHVNLAAAFRHLRSPTGADVSVWSTSGRLKISWLTSPSGLRPRPAVPASAPGSSDAASSNQIYQSFGHSPQSQPDRVQAQKSGKRASVSSRKKKASQITMGFDDDTEKP